MRKDSKYEEKWKGGTCDDKMKGIDFGPYCPQAILSVGRPSDEEISFHKSSPRVIYSVATYYRSCRKEV